MAVWSALFFALPVVPMMAAGAVSGPVAAALIGVGLLCGAQTGHDSRNGLLPLTETALIAGLGAVALALGRISAVDAALGSAGGVVLFWGINQLWLRGRGQLALGGGDVRLIAALGLWVGLSGLGALLALAALLALGFALITGRRGRLAFGPFLCAAALAVVWADALAIGGMAGYGWAGFP